MNNLSWLLYFAGIATGVKVVAIIFSIILVVCTIVAIVAYNDRYANEEDKKLAAKYGKLCGWLAPVLLLVGLIVPGEKTLYLIAASETGEQVVNSETGKKAQAALNRYLDQIGQPEEAE